MTVELPRELFERGDREAIKKHFDAQHAIRYGTSAPGEPAELVSLRTTVTGVMRKPPRHTVPAGGAEPEPEALSRRKPVYFGDAARHARLRARPPEGRQPHRRARADRGARLHHRPGPRRYAGGRHRR